MTQHKRSEKFGIQDDKDLHISHPKSFNFYEKIGKEMESYTKMSDNQLHERKCKTFSISL